MSSKVALGQPHCLASLPWVLRLTPASLPCPGAAFTCLETAFRLDALHRQMKLLGEDSPVSKLQVKLEPGSAPKPEGLLTHPVLPLSPPAGSWQSPGTRSPRTASPRLPPACCHLSPLTGAQCLSRWWVAPRAGWAVALHCQASGCMRDGGLRPFRPSLPDPPTPCPGAQESGRRPEPVLFQG